MPKVERRTDGLTQAVNLLRLSLSQIHQANVSLDASHSAHACAA